MRFAVEKSGRQNGDAYHKRPTAFEGQVMFTVGRDPSGRWLVMDRDNSTIGIFRDRASAVHFAMYESDHVPQAVCCLPDGEVFRTISGTPIQRTRTGSNTNTGS